MKGEGFKCPLGASHLCSLSFHASGSDTLQFQRNWVVFIMPSSSSFTLLQGNSADVRQEIQGWMNGWMDGSWGGMALNLVQGPALKFTSVFNGKVPHTYIHTYIYIYIYIYIPAAGEHEEIIF
jgi:hypothetical protein